MKNTEAAFLWIVGILQGHKIPFLITGGFAARLYGATRELADIDLEIPEDRFSELLPELKDYSKFGLNQYRDEEFDVLLLSLLYEGQDIDISGAYKTKIFDRDKKEWISTKSDFSKANPMIVYGIEVLVIEKNELIEYKKILARDVDKIDVEQMTSN